ncbi:TatD family hydrolase [Bacteroidia bacterium]|nr:TatD family hydrolase [Bacteroidia bacterium]
MYLVDTHTHIFSEEFDTDREAIIKNAIDHGVRQFFMPNIDTSSIDRLNNLAGHYPGICFPMMGLHPTSVNAHYLKELEIIYKEFDHQKYVAVGEIGIDLYWDKTFLKEQIAAFETQLQWSIEKNLPVDIHTREAFPQVLESLHKIGVDKLRGIFHSFGGTREELEACLQCPHFLLGINGVVTYKKAEFREYLAHAPLTRIVLETDAPYLTPVPFRGKRNEPAHLIYTAQKLAEIYGVPIETIAEQTTENARKLFMPD